MRSFFEFLTLFDWITPSIGFFQDIINDPTLLQSNSWTFFIPYEQALNSGWNANDIENLMEKYGIYHWGGQYTFPNGEYFFRVNLEQAQWAEYLLLRHGVPLNEKFLGAPPPKRKNRRKSQRKNQNSNTDIFSFLDRLFGED